MSEERNSKSSIDEKDIERSHGKANAIAKLTDNLTHLVAIDALAIAEFDDPNIDKGALVLGQSEMSSDSLQVSDTPTIFRG